MLFVQAVHDEWYVGKLALKVRTIGPTLLDVDAAAAVVIRNVKRLSSHWTLKHKKLECEKNEKMSFFNYDGKAWAAAGGRQPASRRHEMVSGKKDCNKFDVIRHGIVGVHKSHAEEYFRKAKMNRSVNRADEQIDNGQKEGLWEASLASGMKQKNVCSVLLWGVHDRWMVSFGRERKGKSPNSLSLTPSLFLSINARVTDKRGRERERERESSCCSFKVKGRERVRDFIRLKQASKVVQGRRSWGYWTLFLCEWERKKTASMLFSDGAMYSTLKYQAGKS